MFGECEVCDEVNGLEEVMSGEEGVEEA